MKELGKFLGIFLLLTLIIFSVLQIRSLNNTVAGNDTCPDGGEWTKIDSGDLNLYPVENAVEYCFKASNFIVSQIPDGGFGQDGSCNNGVQYCELSHWSYKVLVNNPTPTPTENPEPTPTDEPDVTPTPTKEPDATPTPTEEPDVTPTPEDDEDPSPTPTIEQESDPSPTPTPTPYQIGTQVGGISTDNGDSNSDNGTDSSSTQAILATNNFSSLSESFNSGASVLAATGGFMNSLMNSMAISGIATLLLGSFYHVKKNQAK